MRGKRQNPEMKDQALSLLKAGASVASVARSLELPDATVRSWARKLTIQSYKMAQNGTRFSWGPKQEKALELVWNADLNDQEIAAELGISRMTLYRWRQRPEFKARIRQKLALR